MEETTIAAISTAYGEAGIGIVRMSGPESLSVLKKVFAKGKTGAPSRDAEIKPRHMYYGRVVDPADGSTVDECLAVYMPGPESYTGEDVAELQCHGSIISYRKILSLLLKNGAEAAAPGEFTKRAFLNGRMDLAQAEAVIDIIKARSARSFDCAVEQLSGGLSGRVEGIRKQLLDVLVDLTVNMDYPDEDIEEMTYGGLIDRLSSINDEILKLKESSSEGRIVREGLLTAIVGKPNVGKSSLMNLLLREERSIVTDIPGTTRDTIEEQISLRGLTLRFVDTAGIRDSADKVESIGIERSKDAFNRADLLLIVLDRSTALSSEDRELLLMAQGRPSIIIYNKEDLPEAEGSGLTSARTLLPDAPVVSISSSTGAGLDSLVDAIEAFVTGGRVRREDDVLVTNIRHIDLIERACAELDEALKASRAGEAMDFIEVNVRAAFDLLGEITGQTASGEVIDEVFSRFCLGK